MRNVPLMQLRVKEEAKLAEFLSLHNPNCLREKMRKKFKFLKEKKT